MDFKIATWNVNSLKVRFHQVLTWLEQHQPDVLALQETKVIDEDFPFEAIRALGFHVIYCGQKAYNGVAIISKSAPKEVQTDIPRLSDLQRRILMATIDDIRIINLYVPNGESVDSLKYSYKLDWLEKITDFIKASLDKYPKLIVLGDFNIAPHPEDVYDPKKWAGKVLFSEPERSAFQGLLEVGLNDCFRLFEQPQNSYSWWNYRTFAIRRNRGLRIDHILASHTLAKLCSECTIDKEPRLVERPSDHAPVVAIFHN